MCTNVFLRSTRRQPVRTIFLLLVIALVTFTFVGRASEYLLIEQETTRLAEYYRSVGILKARTREARENTPEAKRLLERSPYVKLVEQRQYVSGVMEGIYNADTTLDDAFYGKNSVYGTPDVIFYGTLNQLTSAGLDFTVDTVLAGRPEIIQAGSDIFLENNLKILDNTAGIWRPDSAI